MTYSKRNRLAKLEHAAKEQEGTLVVFRTFYENRDGSIGDTSIRALHIRGEGDTKYYIRKCDDTRSDFLERIRSETGEEIAY